MNLDRKFIATVIPEVIFQGVELVITGEWTVDSRIVKQGDLFVALKGSVVDGHDFVIDALGRGAAAVMISESRWAELSAALVPYVAKVHVIIVPDTYKALIALAMAWRERFTYPVIGITGSVGKTTTKELLAAIMRAHGKNVVASTGNQNTLIGLAINVMRMRADHDYAIFELGISRRGEMAELARLAKPTMGVITALGHSHMEGLGSLGDIATEKRDIFAYLKPDGVGVINGDQPLLSGFAYSHPVIKFGYKMINQVQARQVQCHFGSIQFALKLYRERYTVRLAGENQSRVYNALAAATVAYYFGVPAATILRAIEQDLHVEGRFQKRFVRSTQSIIIDDSYNASPESMKAALIAFEQLESSGKKIAVLGDMLELGINAPFWHRQLGRFLRKSPSLSHVIFVGEQMKWAGKAAPYGLSYELKNNWEEVVQALRDRLTTGQVSVLIKASRGMAFNKLVNLLADPLES